MINRDGPDGTLAAFRASAPTQVGLLLGTAGGNPEGTLDTPEPMTGHGAAIDQALADHEGRLSALEGAHTFGEDQ